MFLNIFKMYVRFLIILNFMHRIIMATKRKQWAADSMMQACNAVKNEQMGPS